MNHHSTLTRALAAVTFIALTATATFARPAAPVIPDVGAAEVTQALDRLTAENDQRVLASIEASIATIRAEANDNVPVIAPARTRPTAVVEVHLPRGHRPQRRA